MQSRIQIYTDENGNKSSIIVPYEEWTRLHERIAMLEGKLRVFSSIRSGMAEVASARRSGKKLQRLSDFIDESRG